MKFPFSWFVGFRYTRAKRTNHFISFIALASIIGIALGVMVLITVLSVMNGFERELRERILGTVPHVTVGVRGEDFANWQELGEQIKQIPDVVAVAPYIDANAMFRNMSTTSYGQMRGINPDEETKVSILNDFMVLGGFEKLEPGKFGIILGSGLAASLGVSMGDKVTVLVADGATVSPAGIAPRYKRFTVVGIFEVRSEADGRVAMVHINDAAKLMRKGDKVEAVQVKVQNVLDAHVVASQVRAALGFNYWVSDWNRVYGSLFRAIKMEKTMMFVLLTLIVAVAAFNIVSTMVMVVTDKQSDIAILRTLGASPGTVMRVFIVQGSINGVVGTLFGVLFGVLLTLNLPDIVQFLESTLSVSVVPADVYFIGFLPTQLEVSDVVKITVSALLMSVVATLYPAWRAAKTKPAEALRYE
ncbi:lipoprotein-releasing ABC transporter permease subunit [Pleionea sp. CnH1-48]|uniref:lipoprotein-releasing ABC transporter permease subunit n=1 Tax=Pleionea sp. CnH1-48 TaxID=2954494 RepID=UPI002096C2C2|nr:lipoprotein-releasing ABC transporter permease subunit [Pleionea sp. CnH1-48]MCO7225846.1 lipoprotein-releasing ABC transporter permease subunit [Pleionea sp. CnH1-48]